MKWKKLGQIFIPSVISNYSYAMYPVVEIIDEKAGLIRIYYTHRDKNNYGFPSYFDAEIAAEEFRINYNHDEPIIDHSTLGHFDDSGVSLTSFVNTPSGTLLYYHGWNLGVTVPFRLSIGVAKRIKNSIFLKRLYQGPILDRSKEYPNFCSAPFVLFDNGLYKMWFSSGDPWLVTDKGPQVACHVGYAESRNGIDWVRYSTPAVSCDNNDHVVAAPCVIKDPDLYRMWYSYRGNKYRIGYAESLDGKVFVRKDNEVGITVSSDGWDSEMVCYPCVFDILNNRYMIYCGNSYGKTGFGFAIKS
jgi:predicted GH43/DUF377 family glycosyl hydrolase